jgi:hypothetical protein
MLYLRVERYIILSVIVLLCIVNAAITTRFFFSDEIEIISITKTVLFTSLLPILVSVISQMIYTQQSRAKTIAFVEFDMEKDRRKHLISIMWLCAVCFNTLNAIYIHIDSNVRIH